MDPASQRPGVDRAAISDEAGKAVARVVPNCGHGGSSDCH